MSKRWIDCLEILFSRIHVKTSRLKRNMFVAGERLKKNVPFCYVKMILEGGSIMCIDKNVDFNVVGMMLQTLQVIQGEGLEKEEESVQPKTDH